MKQILYKVAISIMFVVFSTTNAKSQGIVNVKSLGNVKGLGNVINTIKWLFSKKQDSLFMKLPFTKDGKMTHFKINRYGDAILDKDINLGNYMKLKQQANRNNQLAIIQGDRWDGGCVYYSFENLNNTQKYLILQAFHFFDNTNVRFIPKSNSTPKFFKFKFICDVSNSPIGYQSDNNTAKINKDASVGEIAHELMHILGFYHTHQRVDRNTFVIPNGSGDNIDIQPYIWCLGTPAYDYGSITHYSTTSSDRVLECANISTLPSTLYQGNCHNAGQRSALSSVDEQIINDCYNTLCQ